jgi:hypothetical protein
MAHLRQRAPVCPGHGLGLRLAHDSNKLDLIIVNHLWNNLGEERSSYRDAPVTRALFFEN